MAFGAGPASFVEFRQGALWYLNYQFHDNFFFLPLLALTLVLGLVTLVVAVNGRLKFRRAVSRGAVPHREVAAVDGDRLVRRARAVLEPELNRSTPNVDRIVDLLFSLPLELGASDLSLRPKGMLVEVQLTVGLDQIAISTLPHGLHEKIVERVRKILGADDHALKTDGDVDFRWSQSHQHFRVELSPTSGGVGLSIHKEGASGLALADLGMDVATLHGFKEAIGREKGLVLVGGKMGNGVTTTLYAAIHQIHKDRKLPQGIASLERVVQQELPYVHQTELGSGNAAAVLEEIATRRPDVLLLRQVDGQALADLAFEIASERAMVVAATPGQSAAELLVSAWEFVGGDRLAQCHPSVLAQRLIERLCPACATAASVLPNQQIAGWDFTGDFQAATGCDTCHFTGNVGKVALHQWIAFSDGLAKHLREVESANQLHERLGSLTPSFAELALNRARAGETTIEQVIALIHEEQTHVR